MFKKHAKLQKLCLFTVISYVCTLFIFIEPMIYHEKALLTPFLISQKELGKSIGLVPTMGALHKGHLSLIQQAANENDLVIVSIFVNPTQFDNAADLEKYPRTLNHDLLQLESISGAVLVYAPSVNDVYDNNIAASHFDFNGLENEMEGEFRSGHFDGVATIVKRLFEITLADKAYFGEKDFQQLQIIRKLVLKHQISITIIGCSIQREKNGLAMSSRNKRLNKDEQQQATFIYKTLQKAKRKFGTESATTVVQWVTKQFSNHPFLKLEYFKIAEISTLKSVKRKAKNKKYRAFVAVYANDVRLIDNIALN